MPKLLKTILLIVAALALFFVGLLFFIKAPEREDIVWGVNFSQMQAENLELDWKETYLAILDDLKVENIKLLANWDKIETEKGRYYFDDIDWQVKEAEKRGVKMIYVTGMKSGRWPECHIPEWAKNLSKKEQQEAILDYVEKSVLRYKNNNAIIAWQAENEPLFPFGECPWRDKNFLKKEAALIKSLDPGKPVIISDTGEFSLWINAAEIGDIVGTTMYRRVWFHISDMYGFYFVSPFPPAIYWQKALLIKKLFNKDVINVELQAEPWVRDTFLITPLKDQEKIMNLEKLKENIAFAKESGLDTFYFWGVEWWYWLKNDKNKPEIWNYAKRLFN